jgi:hypothetical protein
MITSSRTLYIPDITGVILIDCWNLSDQNIAIKESIRCFYYNLIQDVKRYTVSTVINAMTQTHLYQPDVQIKQELFAGRKVLNMDTMQAFDRYLQQTPNAPQHWYVAGQSWNMCVHDNDMGLKSFNTKMSRHAVNFYATEKSFLHLDGTEVGYQDFEKDYLDWKFLNWFGYQLQGEQEC